MTQDPPRLSFHLRDLLQDLLKPWWDGTYVHDEPPLQIGLNQRDPNPEMVLVSHEDGGVMFLPLSPHEGRHGDLFHVKLTRHHPPGWGAARVPVRKGWMLEYRFEGSPFVLHVSSPVESPDRAGHVTVWNVTYLTHSSAHVNVAELLKLWDPMDIPSWDYLAAETRLLIWDMLVMAAPEGLRTGSNRP